MLLLTTLLDLGDVRPAKSYSQSYYHIRLYGCHIGMVTALFGRSELIHRLGPGAEIHEVTANLESLPAHLENVHFFDHRVAHSLTLIRRVLDVMIGLLTIYHASSREWLPVGRRCALFELRTGCARRPRPHRSLSTNSMPRCLGGGSSLSVRHNIVTSVSIR